jgi:hypothetical protein
MDPVAYQTVLVTIVAVIFGTYVDRAFAHLDPRLSLVQIALNGLAVKYMRSFVQVDGNAWILCASALMAGQTTLMARVKKVLRLEK